MKHTRASLFKISYVIQKYSISYFAAKAKILSYNNALWNEKGISFPLQYCQFML